MSIKKKLGLGLASAALRIIVDWWGDICIL